MFSHITLGTNDLERALEFYDAILEPLGIVRSLSSPEHGFAAYGPPGGKPGFFVCLPFNEKEATAGNGTHAAFLAPSREAVDAFHACGLALGATDEGAPGPAAPLSRALLWRLPARSRRQQASGLLPCSGLTRS